MRTLIGALVLLTLGCGVGIEPAEEDGPVDTRTDAVITKSDTPAAEVMQRWEVVLTDEGLMFRLVQDPVEERFFVDVNVTQPAPQVPSPPCPTCR